MRTSIRLLLTLTLTLLLASCLGGLTACATERTVVVPDSRVLVHLVNGVGPMPGWYGISGGYLREIYRKCGEVK